jgi:hypothetical protein
VVADSRFYSCVGNMILLPTPLKAFTDTLPEIKAALRICARNLYDWRCDHDSMKSVNSALDQWTDWSSYPASWPRFPNQQRPLGTVELTPWIAAAAAKRLTTIRRDLQFAGKYYPKSAVRLALAYWRINETA